MVPVLRTDKQKADRGKNKMRLEKQALGQQPQ